MFETGAENGEARASLTTARHLPTQDRSAPPQQGPWQGARQGPGQSAGPGDCADFCDLVTVPARQGLEAVDILRRGAGDAVGPVLHDGGCDTLGFLVPPGTAAGWDLPGSACTQTFGRGTRPHTEPGPATPPPPVAGTGWLLSPAETDPVTDPAVLRAALGIAARTIEAADNCR
ncbi:hypothetical protein GCM10010277_16070 [Streptomyces longisporoflavus]|uniref:hypothetical protein n=1 Tax=Streptomyces longisporoflavus TaxID=28044 RepID=UPI00167D2599|nr:hypothetical protein [Streptomyces longisporoflavus]GGV31950.1 hypothetical protein GCM10010277_16070 [Streptomyces longisporoflavus]